ncbi:MAG: FliA/WhiG family RNA polymerase sigma factor [Nitrospinota bacterium]|nr:MAG: FliA/WhiG family RNA polymerase sigma factor [Nitrospinota bacterium]
MSGIPKSYTRRGKEIDPQEKERLILEYAPLIKYIAQRLAMRLPPHISAEDLINAGVIGLIDAIEKYDPSRDNTFKTYAEFRIRGAMLDELRSLDWAPRSVRQKANTIERAYETLERDLGRSASDEEVATLLGINLHEFYTWLHQIRGTALLSIDALTTPTADGEELNLLEILSNPEEQSPFQLVQAQRLRDMVAEAIDRLPYQEKVVISLYYYEELTMKEIGEVMGITESRVSQIHTKAILRLRGRLKILQEEWK